MSFFASLKGLFTRSKAVQRRSRLEVLHGPVTPTAELGVASSDDSAGEVRLFSYEGVTTEGQLVFMDWIMTTTGYVPQRPDIERRITTAAFVFGAEPREGEIVIEGMGLYPSGGSTFVADSQLVRPITGGSGAYSGASGQLLSTHFDDGNWSHQFFLTGALSFATDVQFEYVVGLGGSDAFDLDVMRCDVVDVIVNFDPKDDRLVIGSLPSSRAQRFASGDVVVAARGLKGLNKKLQAGAPLVYETTFGGLYSTANTADHGSERKPCLLAVLDGAPSFGGLNVVLA